MNKIYYFGADWCPQCCAIHPQFDKFCELMNIKYEYIDAESDNELINNLHIKNLPTIIEINNNNEVIYRGIGFDGFKQFKENHTNASV